MTTEKQITANQQNALKSTGPITEEGKVTVTQNPIKHGILVKDLIIKKGDGKEDAKEFNDMLKNLMQSLRPNDQMESLLVEKIAVDFWRLKRILNFETGSIRKYVDTVIYDYYHQKKSGDKVITHPQRGWLNGCEPSQRRPVCKLLLELT